MRTFDVHCGGAADVLSRVQDGTFAAVITDPPAGINLFGQAWDNPECYESATKKNNPRTAFINYLGAIFAKCFQKTSEAAILVTWTLPKTSHWTAKALEKGGWHINSEFYHIFATGMPKSLNISSAVYKSTQDAQIATTWKGWGTSLKPAYEKWLVASKKSTPVANYNYYYCKKIGKAEREIGDLINNHPSVKSVELMRQIITTYTKPGDLILDPFMGSGSTGIACCQLGRLFYGIEQEPEYFNIAEKRLFKFGLNQPEQIEF